MAKTFKRAIAVLLSVLMIATTLPFTAITAMAADSVTYNFNVNATNKDKGNDYNGDIVEDGHKYDLFGEWNKDTAHTLNGILSLNNGCLFVNDQDVRNYFSEGAFSVVFKGRHHAETNRVLATVSSNVHVFIRLDANGDFYVNNAKATTIDLAGGANNTYAFSYDGANTVELYVNGIKRASVNASLDIPDDTTVRYVSLGWADNTMGDKMDNASFDFLTINNDVYDPSTFTAGKKASATADVNVKTGNGTGYFNNDVSTNYYSSLLYSQQGNVTWIGNGNGGTLVEHDMEFKLAVPANMVALYDGKTDITFPLKAELTCKNNKNRYIHYIDSATAGFSYKNTWNNVGDDNNSYLYWNPDSYRWANADAGYSSDSVGQSKYENMKNNHKFYLNRCYYNPTIGDAYYSKVTTLAAKMHFDSASGGNPENTVSTISNNQVNIYAINYKPIADIYDTVKDKVADVASKADGYYVNADEFYSVAANLLNLDPNAYGYGNTYYDVLACAQDIKEAVIDYNAVELVKHECVAGEIVKENIVAPTISKAGSHDNVTYCTICNVEMSRTPVVDDATGNYEAYNTAVAEATELKEEDYTPATWAKLEEALGEADTKEKSAATQGDIDAATTMIQTAVNNLIRATVDVTFVVEYNGAVVDTDFESVKVGEVYSPNTESTKAVKKWTVKTEGFDMYSVPSGASSIDVVIQNTTEIHAYLTDIEEVAINDIKVTYLDNIGRPLNVEYVKDTANVNLADATFARKLPFYNFVEWGIVPVGTNEYVAVPSYEPVSLGNTCDVTLVGITRNGADYFSSYYDERFELDSKDGYLEFTTAEGTVYYLKNSGTFNTPHTSSLTVELVDEADASTQTVAAIKSVNETGTPVVTFDATYCLPKGAEIEHAGIIASTQKSEFVGGEAGVLTFESNFAKDSDQYSVKITSTFGGASKVYGRSFVIYNVDGSRYVMYGDVIAVNL